MENVSEMLKLIEKIKSHSRPPIDNSDPYFKRYPWQKLGGVSSNAFMSWCWYRDDVILEYAAKEDILYALDEFERSNI
jgi:hypothetical protein